MRRKLAIGIVLILCNTVWQVAGVVYLGWPMGNVFILMWFENVLLTFIALGRMIAYRNTEGFSWKEFIERFIQLPVFTAAHAVFTGALAWFTGYELSTATLYLPAALITMRYLVEVWQQRDCPPHKFSETYGFALNRIAMLHFSIIMCWGAAIPAGFGLSPHPPRGIWYLRFAALLILLTIKTVVEIVILVRGPRRDDDSGHRKRRISLRR